LHKDLQQSSEDLLNTQKIINAEIEKRIELQNQAISAGTQDINADEGSRHAMSAAESLEERLNTIKAISSEISRYSVDVYENFGLDNDDYGEQIVDLKQLIELQKEYLALGGQQSDLIYSEEYLQKQIDGIETLAKNADKVQQLKRDIGEVFEGLSFADSPYSSEFNSIFMQLQEGLIDYNTALDRTIQLIHQEQDINADEGSEYKSEADSIEQRNEALKEGNILKAQEDDLNHQNISGTGTLVDTDVYKGDINAEIQQLENLKAILLEVEQAVQAKTQAFRDEGVVVEQTVSREVEALRELLLALGYIKSAADTINDTFTQRSDMLALPSSSSDVVAGGYALDTTLQVTNGILKTISEKLSGNEALTGLVEPLNNAVTELKNAAQSVAE
jgi:hypothetical protein